MPGPEQTLTQSINIVSILQVLDCKVYTKSHSQDLFTLIAAHFAEAEQHVWGLHTLAWQKKTTKHHLNLLDHMQL